MGEIDGILLYRLFSAGTKRLGEEKRELDRINVFPVADGDTGSNMAYTLRSAMASSTEHASAAVVAARLSDAALAGARGNSGMILAQFMAGFREGIAGRAALSLDSFVSSMENACARAYQALSHPVEGTMLTAIRAWTEGLMHARSQSDSLSGLLAAAHPKLSEAVRHTPDELAALKEAGVVDAGAKGFAAFIEGFRDYAAGRLSETDLAAEGDAELPPIDRSEEPAAAPPDLRYCCEFLLRARTGETLDPQAIRTLLERYGDSVIVAGGGKAARAHIHGDDPGQLAALLSRVAVIEDQKVDDMALQYLDAHERLSDVAILTDSACDLSSELVLGHRIHVVPLSVNFGEEAYLDKLTMTPARFYEEAESSRTFPTSSQPSAQRFRRVYEALAARYSSIIAIHLSASMSGTFEASAREADAVARNGRTRIDVYDSRHLSGSLGLIVLKAAEMAAAGASHDDILAALPGLSLSAENLVSVRTLDYMVRGGRVSPLKGALAKALNLKPIVSVDKRGKSVLYGKSFRIRNNESKIIAMAKAMAAERGIGRWAVVHAHAEREAKDFAARMESALGSAPAYLCEVSCIVGLNSGRGAVSFVCL